MDGGDLLTVQEVSQYLRKSKSTIYRLTREGRLPGKKIGGTWRYSRRRIDELFRPAPVASEPSPILDKEPNRVIIAD
jgi:excisionase family DNA binding protein